MPQKSRWLLGGGEADKNEIKMRSAEEGHKGVNEEEHKGVNNEEH